jgi:ABC-type nickel/cobalt efflux system permease component RcnA
LFLYATLSEEAAFLVRRPYSGKKEGKRGGRKRGLLYCNTRETQPLPRFSFFPSSTPTTPSRKHPRTQEHPHPHTHTLTHTHAHAQKQQQQQQQPVQRKWC